MKNQPDIKTQPPEEKRTISTVIPPKIAGGIPAVLSAIKHSIREMGIVRSIKTLSRLNQHEGYDCPSCAWPDPEERAKVEFCENGVKAVAEEATKKKVIPEFFERWSISKLSQQSDYWLGKQGRLTHPMWLKTGETFYQPIEWQDAFDLIAEKLNSLKTPDEAAFYTSGRTSNEAAFLYQLFVRLFGTNNLPDCSNMCHESSSVALKEVIGVGKGTVKLEDFNYADTIFVIGQNPGTNHPRMLTALQQAARNGCKIVSINPLPEAGMIRFKHPQEIRGLVGAGTELATLFLQVKINGDVALLKGIIKEMLIAEEKNPGSVIDRNFVDNFTSGFFEFDKDITQTTWETITEESGVNRDQIYEAAQVAINSKRMIWCWAMGLTQHKNAVANIQEIINLLLLGGHFGRKGAGVCPVRGHSNVQGDRTMGIWEKPTKDFLDNLENEFHFEPPREPGFNTVEAIEAMAENKVKVFFALGGNFLSATPDTEFTANAIRKCELTVQVSTKLNRAHLVTGKQALILPCLARSERDVVDGKAQFVSVENSMGIVHRSSGNLAPTSKYLKSEPSIVAQLAKATFKNQPDKANKVRWKYLSADYNRIRDVIERVIPGFTDYNQRVRRPGGFYLPNPVRDEKVFNTSNKKAQFTIHTIKRTNLPQGHYIMMTIRSHDQYNTTIYGLEDRYRGIANGRRVILMNKEDMREASFKKKGQYVDITSHFQGQKRIAKKFVVVPYAIPRKCVATYFPEANVLVPIGSIADKSHTPASKSVQVSLAPA